MSTMVWFEKAEFEVRTRAARLARVIKSVRWYLYWTRRRMTCKHTHTWTTEPSKTWEARGRDRGGHGGLKLRGCYLCGHVWTCDTGGPCGPFSPPSHREEW